MLRLWKTYQSQTGSITKKIVKCVRDSKRTFSNWKQNVLVTKSKDEECQTHISKVSIEIEWTSTGDLSLHGQRQF